MILVDNVDNSVDKTKLLNRIRTAIENADLTQEEIAERVGVDAVTISRWKNGTRIPKADLIIPLCKATEVTPGWLYGCEERPRLSIKPKIDNGEIVEVVGNKRQIAALMDKHEFEDFCRIWQEVQDDFG